MASATLTKPAIFAGIALVIFETISQQKFYNVNFTNMALSKSLVRQSHFLGTKIRNLRKRNHLTMEDLSARCIRINPEYAPSVSYLSMIERGKRVPSIDMLEVIAQVFQKNPTWFLDDESEQQAIAPDKGNRGGISGMALEPSFLFSNDRKLIIKFTFKKF